MSKDPKVQALHNDRILLFLGIVKASNYFTQESINNLYKFYKEKNVDVWISSLCIIAAGNGVTDTCVNHPITVLYYIITTT